VPIIKTYSLLLFFTALWLSGCSTEIQKTVITDRDVEIPIPTKQLDQTKILEASVNEKILTSGEYSEKPIMQYQKTATMSETAIANIKHRHRKILFELPPKRLTLEGRSADSNYYQYPTSHPPAFRVDKIGGTAYGGLITSTNNPTLATHIYWNWMGKSPKNNEYFTARLSKPIELKPGRKITDPRFTSGVKILTLSYSGMSNEILNFKLDILTRHRTKDYIATTAYKPGMEIRIQKARILIVKADSTSIKYKIIHPFE